MPMFKWVSFSYVVALMNDPRDQLDFNFAADDMLEFPRDLGEEGWFQFHTEQKLAYQRIERKFGIVLNQRVRVRLRGEMVDHEGKLVLDTLQMPRVCAESITLRVGHVVFENTDIDELVVL